MSGNIPYLSSLQQGRDELLHAASQWSGEQLHLRPRVHAWSALEMFDHLARTEQNAAAQIRAQLEVRNKQVSRVTPSRIILFAIMRSSLRVNVPRGAEDLHPSSPGSLDLAFGNWMRASARLQSTLGEVSPKDRDLGVFRHPIGGWMNAVTTVQFLKLHLDHHLRQWNRLAATVC